MISKRDLLAGIGTCVLAALAKPWRQISARAATGPVFSVEAFGARPAARDNTAAIQSAIAAAEQAGGGVILIRGRYRCGKLVIGGSNIRIAGQQGSLVDARLTIQPQSSNIAVADLTLIDTTGDASSYLFDISGRDCTFSNVSLVKDPIAGGYQMYLRQASSGCRFSGLRLRGSNGVMLAGQHHLFEDFDFTSTMSKRVGGDDAFAIKALGARTGDIVITNGVVRGFSAIVSFGSEIGAQGGVGPAGVVDNILVENVTGDRCGGAAFFKPGALIYDWRNGVIENVVLRNLRLSDPTGEQFRIGIRMVVARGSTIRNVRASQISIVARAKDRRVAPTAAIDLTLLDVGAAGRIEDVRIQMKFVDPYSGAPRGPKTKGEPVDYISKIEKRNPARGAVSGIVLDIEGKGASAGGIYLGDGLDDAVTVKRAVLTDVATDPLSSAGGGIWSNSRVKLGAVSIASVKLPKFGGRAFARSNR